MGGSFWSMLGRSKRHQRMPMKTIPLIFVVGASFIVSCSDLGTSSQIQLDSSINGKTASYVLQQQFSLELDVNADGGYQWDCKFSDSTVLKIDSTSYKPKNPVPIVVGGLTVETFHFRAMHTGQSTINLSERQEWMKDVPPISTVRFVVVVR
jgi:predicted secreted protein